jgi:IS5 family transposase
MLVDRYDPEDVFARVPEVATQTDPVLKKLDGLLDDDQLYRQVRADLGKRYRLTLVHGRHSTPVEVILRLLLCKHLYGWSYEQTRERVADSLVLCWFCRAYFQAVPDKSTLIRWTHTLRPETLHARECPHRRTGEAGQDDQGAQAAVGCHLCADRDPSSALPVGCSSIVCGCSLGW